MTLTGKFLPGCVGLSTGAFVLGCALAGLWFLALPVLILGVAWLVALSRGWDWMAPLGLALSTIAAAAGLLLGAGVGWMLSGLVAALGAWDLHHFSRLLDRVPRIEGARDLERRHLQRLFIAGVLGLLLAAVALDFEVRLSFGLVVVLGLIAILGLSRAVSFLRSESD